MIFVPVGYASALSVKNMIPRFETCSPSRWVREFAQDFIRAYDLEPIEWATSPLPLPFSHALSVASSSTLSSSSVNPALPGLPPSSQSLHPPPALLIPQPAALPGPPPQSPPLLAHPHSASLPQLPPLHPQLQAIAVDQNNNNNNNPSFPLLRLTLVLRKPYFAHPRLNPLQLFASRQIFNEVELLSTLRQRLADVCTVSFVSFESMPFGEQLALMLRTDILVGIHGAGLSHTLFLPRNRALLGIAPEPYAGL